MEHPPPRAGPSLGESAFDLVYSAFALSLAFATALLVIAAAWCLVWKLVLSKVPFFREIVGINPPAGKIRRPRRRTSSISGKESNVLKRPNAAPSSFREKDSDSPRRPSTPQTDAVEPASDGGSSTGTRPAEVAVQPSPKTRARVRFGIEELVFEDDYIRR